MDWSRISIIVSTFPFPSVESFFIHDWNETTFIGFLVAFRYSANSRILSESSGDVFAITQRAMPNASESKREEFDFFFFSKTATAVFLVSVIVSVL